MAVRCVAVILSFALVACADTSTAILAAPETQTATAAVSDFDPNDARAVGIARFARLSSGPEVALADDRDCADFATAHAAQDFFMANGGPVRDPHDLDRDGDGFACEWGTELRQASAARAAAPRQLTTRPRCYVGPRGGTYTITASGNRNYGGC